MIDKLTKSKTATLSTLGALVAMVLSALFTHASTASGVHEYYYNPADDTLTPKKTLLLKSNGVYDINDPEFTPPDYNHFVTEIMGWSSEEIDEFEQQAREFFRTKFGIDVQAPEYQGRVAMVPFMLDPRWEYRLYHSSGSYVPRHGRVVRDGGFQLVALDPEGVELGGDFSGQHAPQGAVAAFGIFNIERRYRKDTIIRYQSREPVLQNSGFPLKRDGQGVLIAPFDVFHEKYGHGWAFAHIWEVVQEDGRIQTNNRNVITFPAGAAFPEWLQNH